MLHMCRNAYADSLCSCCSNSRIRSDFRHHTAHYLQRYRYRIPWGVEEAEEVGVGGSKNRSVEHHTVPCCSTPACRVSDCWRQYYFHNIVWSDSHWDRWGWNHHCNDVGYFQPCSTHMPEDLAEVFHRISTSSEHIDGNHSTLRCCRQCTAHWGMHSGRPEYFRCSTVRLMMCHSRRIAEVSDSCRCRYKHQIHSDSRRRIARHFAPRCLHRLWEQICIQPCRMPLRCRHHTVPLH